MVGPATLAVLALARDTLAASDEGRIDAAERLALALAPEYGRGEEGDRALAFDVAQGFYYGCTENYEGQGDSRYALACSLGYRPGACERGPDEGLASDVAALFEGT